MKRPRADSPRPTFSLDLTGQLDVVFHAVEGAGDHPGGAGGVSLRRSNFFPDRRSRRGRPGRSVAWCSASICRSGSYLLLEVDSNYVQKKLDQIRDDARRVLRDNKIGYTGLTSRPDSVEFASRKPTCRRR